MNASTSNSQRYFEDFRLDETGESESVALTADEIKAFARDYDPQPFHLDEEAARQSLFGGLAASGWHTCAVTAQLMRRTCLADAAWAAHGGFDGLRWRRPVRPDEALRLRYRCTALPEPAPDASEGEVHFAVEMTNPAGETVMSLTFITRIRRRTSAP